MKFRTDSDAVYEYDGHTITRIHEKPMVDIDGNPLFLPIQQEPVLSASDVVIGFPFTCYLRDRGGLVTTPVREIIS